MEIMNDAAVTTAIERLDGGARAWRQVLAGFLASSISWGFPAAFGVYQLHYTESLGLAASQVSWIGSTQAFLSFFLCTVSGRLADAGHSRTTVLAGGIFTVTGTLMTSFATEYWQVLLSQGVCTGIGLGLTFMPTMYTINSYFESRRALAMSLSASGTSFGSITITLVIQRLTPIIDFAWTVRCVTLVALLFCGTCFLCLKPRSDTVKRPLRGEPLFEWRAFREGPYLLYLLGVTLFFWVFYLGFFYVGPNQSTLLVDTVTDRSSDQHFRSQQARLRSTHCRQPPANHERCWLPSTPLGGLDR